METKKERQTTLDEFEEEQEELKQKFEQETDCPRV